MMNQTIFIPRLCQATLYRKVQDKGGGLQYVEGPRLLRDFHVGGITQVGSIFARTFASDWWMTSNIKEITKVVEKPHKLVHIHYQTLNTAYVLEVSSEVIQFRHDMGKLIDLTQNGDMESDEWITEAIRFKEVADNEYEDRKKAESNIEATEDGGPIGTIPH